MTEEIQGTTKTLIPIQVNPPERFNFTMPGQWPQWKKRFERYMSVSGQNSKAEEDKIDLLIYIMGEESEEIMLQFTSAPTTYEETIHCFTNHFIPRKNIIFERFKFNSRVQRPGETIETFITSLHSMAESCEYSALKDELIRDRIVVGMLDNRTSERMQLQAKLTLADCIIAAKQAELQSIQSKELRNDSSRIGRIGVSNTNKNRATDHGGASQGSGQHKERTTVEEERKTCWFCGLQPHARERCPANKSKCRNCNKMGHWAIVCRKTNVRSIQYVTGNELYLPKENENDFVGSIYVNHVYTSEWKISLFVLQLDREVEFLVDSGADISCMPTSMISLELRKKLKPCNKHVTGPSGVELKVSGILSANLSNLTKQFQTELFIIENLSKPILGRTAIVRLEVLKFGDSIRSANSNSVHNIETDSVLSKFPKIFGSIGTFQTEMEIKLREGAQPFVQSVPRTVSIPLHKPLKDELDRLLKLDIIESVDYYTPWVSPIVVVNKGTKLRLCVDYTQLNKSVLRSYFPIGKVETILAKLQGANYFSRLDATSGFYQIKLKKDCQHLTTFITPFGRFLFKRLRFGITCAPEYFSILLSKILSGIDGVTNHMDDILIYAKSLEEHNNILQQVLKQIQKEGITLNKAKCVFAVQSLRYLGHTISNRSISIDPERNLVIENFPKPENKNELLQFLGIINFSSRFIPNRSVVLEPLTSMLKKNTPFIWDVSQNQAFKAIKVLLKNSPCLAYYDYTKEITISADASSFGLGACLIQTSEGKREIVSYASRLLSQTEKRYAQIEREALALVWAAEKFQEYITGISFKIETDHKPLVQILQSKPIDDLTPRLQRFRIRLMRYQYQIFYTPGKELVVADALSRNFSKDTTLPEENELADETQAYVNFIIQSLQVKSNFLNEIKSEQEKDEVCQKLSEYSYSGWPDKNKIEEELLPYYPHRFEIAINEGYLLKGNRIIVPSSLQLKCLRFIHQGHQGIVKCRARAKSSVWWIGLSTQIENVVRNCPQCVEYRVNPREPFLKEEFPERPWQKIAIDLFKSESWYLIVTDYYSRFFEIFKLKNMTKSIVITKLKELFARCGIPEIVRSDNGPQFQSEFKCFACDYDFQHITSSPYYSQSNGCIEAAVKIAKNLLKKNDDMYLALLAYRTTPLECGFSPSELLMNRKIRSHLPFLPNELSKTVNSKLICGKEDRSKERSALQYNRRHRSKELSKLSIGDSVWVTDIRAYGKIIEILKEPRSYLVETHFGTYRRNRWHLIPAPYHVFPRFTPALPIPNDEREVTETNHFESTSNNVTENSVEEFPEVVPNQTSGQRSRPVSPRPSRTVKKPLYLKDYVYSLVVNHKKGDVV